MAVESEEILSKISDLIESKVDELSTNLNNFRQEASNNNQTLENAIGSIKSVIDGKLSKIDEISSEINSIQTSVQSVTDSVSATNNKIDNILSQQTQLQRTVDSVSQNIEKLSTVTNNQLTYLSNQSQNITEKIDKLSLQQEREARTAAVEGARGTVVVDSATGKTVSGVAAADATGTSEETKQSLIGSVLSGIKGILASPLALGSAALGIRAAALGTAYALRKEPPGTPQAGSNAEFNLSPDTSRDRRTGGQGRQDTSEDRRTGIQESYTGSLDNINKAQLAFIRGLGMTETHFRNQEAYSERYNKPSNNANVRKYGQAGADYGYYQTNELDVKDAIRRGVPKEIARHLHGRGKGGKSTIEQQTLAMHEYLKKLYPKEYNRLEKDPSPEAFEALRQRARRKWFGLKDRPHVARKEFRKFDQDVPSIFPEIQPRQETETAPQPDARREPPQRQETSGYEMPDNVSFSSQSVERRASNLNEETKQSLENFKKLASPGTVVTSAYRSPQHPIERRKRRPGAHARGQAIDIRTRGVSKEDLQKTIQGLKRSGFNYILLEGNPPHIHAERRPNQEGFVIRNLGRGNPHIPLSEARKAANEVELNDAQRQPDAEKQSDAEKQPDIDTRDILNQQQGYKEEAKSRGILPYLGISPAFGDDTKLSAEEVKRRNEEFAEEQYQKSLQQFKSSLGKDSLGDDTGTVYDPTSSEIPKYPENMRRGIMSEDDVESKFLPNIEKKPSMPKGKDIKGRIEKKQPLLNFRDILREPSALGRMLGYERYVDENKMKELMRQAKMLQSMDDVDLTSPKTKPEIEKYLDEILKRARKAEEEAKKQAQQAQPQSQKVLGNLTGPEFFDPRTLAKLKDENTKGDNTGVNSAPRPKHKIKLNYIDPDTLSQEI